MQIRVGLKNFVIIIERRHIKLVLALNNTLRSIFKCFKSTLIILMSDTYIIKNNYIILSNYKPLKIIKGKNLKKLNIGINIILRNIKND
jgi:hypothetical protein